MKNYFKFSTLFTILIFSLISCEKDLTDDLTENTNSSTDINESIETINYDGKTLTVIKKEDNYILDGDIIIPISEVSDQSKSTGTTKSRWPGGVVYYVIDPNLFNKDRVTAAIEHWEKNTRIRFVKRTNQPNYVTFRQGSGCSSNVGMISVPQFITLGNSCSTASVIHEIGHTVGLYHEQNRKDRDKYVNILWENLPSDIITRSQFTRYDEFFNGEGNEYTAFDFGSIMMYNPFAFSINGKPTITKKDGSLYNANSRILSQKDKEGVRRMYFNNLLTAGNKLNKGNFRNSRDGRNYLKMQNDGNVVMYRDGKAVWSTRTNKTTSNRLVMQRDGNLVLYNINNRPTWASGTNGYPNSRLALLNNGDMVIISSSGTVIWSMRRGKLI
ncbi:hypothetical protein GCM10009430_32670 [Aquimarina litoralis]|uniref:Bulb-type lectin domain-containing protein n=1 Tax=Aquimarina litoralis TaxID=584605 RepID=A0ABN1J1U5_9FLAO